MRGRSIPRRVARRELEHQNGRSFFAASRVIRRERAGKKRRKAFLGVLNIVRRPLRQGDGEIVLQHGQRGITPPRTKVRRRASPQSPSDAVAGPLQPLQLGALSLRVLLADVNTSAPLESELLPTGISSQGQIETLAFPIDWIKRRNLP